MTTKPGAIEQHPDLVEMRNRYEQAGETPQAQAVDGLTFLGGLYLAIAPWVVGFDDLPTLAMSNLVTGLALAVLAIGFACAYGRMHSMTWVVPIIGVWTILSPWLVLGADASTSVVLNNIITGGAVTVLGLAVMALGMTATGRFQR